MVDALAYAQQFAELSAQLLHERHERPTLDRVVSLAVETIESSDYGSISIRSGGHFETPAATDPIVLASDQLQYHLGDGPCLEAIAASESCLINDLTADTRWPRWAQQVAELGIGSVLSVRLQGPEHTALASLNLYARQPRAFDDTDLAIATIFARHAGVAIYGVHQHDHLMAAIQSRQLIGAAQGILMQRFSLTLDQAFELLRRYSQTYNVKLRELAENLVRSGGVPTNLDDAAPADACTALAQSLGLSPMTPGRSPNLPKNQ
jgi:GAF domain-containing protein